MPKIMGHNQSNGNRKTHSSKCLQKETGEILHQQLDSTLDLKLASTGMDFEVLNAYCEGLVALDKDSKVIPALAESYTISDDQTVYT